MTLEVIPNMWDTIIMDGGNHVAGWIISLKLGGSAVQPAGSVTVRLQIPASFTGDPGNLTVHHSVGGLYSQMDAGHVNGAMVFTCSQF